MNDGRRLPLAVALVAGLGAGVPAAAPAQVAATPPPSADFTFRSVRPPTDPHAKRLTFNASPPRDATTERFWTTAGDALSAADAGRLGRLALSEAAALNLRWPASSDLAAARRILSAHRGALSSAAAARRVSPALLLAVAVAESGGDARALSPKGAQGLMQLMPATAARFGVADAFDPEAAIAGAAAYLDWLLDRFGGDALLALAGYNAGEAAVERHAGVPPYPETRAYVPRALAAFAAVRGLCAPAPAAARDACLLGR